MSIQFIPAFGAKRSSYSYNISNRAKLINQNEDNNLKDILFDSMRSSSCYLDVDVADVINSLKNIGIKNISEDNGNIYVNTIKGNSFWISTPLKLNDIAANIFVYGELIKPNTFYGINSYLKAFDTLRRSDIVKKGIRMSTSKLCYLSQDDREFTAKNLSRLIGHYVSPKDLFASSSEVYYPDMKNKIIYGAPIANRELNENDISICKFITDSNDNVIGYERRAYEIIRGNIVTSKYVEQQKLDETLPPIVDKEIPYRYALACRFGNYQIPDRYEQGIENVLSQLRNSCPDITKEDLQGIKYTQDGIKKDILIGYYSPVSGRSLIFDKFGNFLYKLEYIKNESGEIIDTIELK